MALETLSGFAGETLAIPGLASSFLRHGCSLTGGAGGGVGFLMLVIPRLLGSIGSFAIHLLRSVFFRLRLYEFYHLDLIYWNHDRGHIRKSDFPVAGQPACLRLSENDRDPANLDTLLTIRIAYVGRSSATPHKCFRD